LNQVAKNPANRLHTESINFEKALKLPGVFAIITGADLPEIASKTEQVGEGAVNTRYLSMNILAREKVLYDGHAVAAGDRHTAEEALRLIEVEYEVLPPVMTVQEAMRPDAPILLQDLRNKEGGPDKQTNVANHIQFKRGDITEGFKTAEHIIEREFDTAMVNVRPRAVMRADLPHRQVTPMPPLCFLQAIDAAHRLNLVSEHVREEARPERESSFPRGPRMMRWPAGGSNLADIEELSACEGKKLARQVWLGPGGLVKATDLGFCRQQLIYARFSLSRIEPVPFGQFPLLLSLVFSASIVRSASRS
jgi:Aldehyde oxidase and xanthine dehydrogenase, a/b hammerhead domain